MWRRQLPPLRLLVASSKLTCLTRGSPELGLWLRKLNYLSFASIEMTLEVFQAVFSFTHTRGGFFIFCIFFCDRAYQRLAILVSDWVGRLGLENQTRNLHCCKVTDEASHTRICRIHLLILNVSKNATHIHVSAPCVTVHEVIITLSADGVGARQDRTG